MAGNPSGEAVVETPSLAFGKRHYLIILGIILALAGALRFYDIANTPPGLYLDEAADGANALEAWETGHFQVFYPQDNGREGLYINSTAVLIHLLGAKAWVLRLPAAVFGLLTVGGVYALTAELFSVPAGLAAAFFLATSVWHIIFSRIAFRAIAAPCFLVWALFCLLSAFRAIREGRSYAPRAVVSGLLYGLGFHTYIAYRITPFLVLLVLVFMFVEARRAGWLKRFWVAGGLFTAASAVVLYPLAAYLIDHPDQVSERVSQVSVFQASSPAARIAINIAKTVDMLYWDGDGNWRHNYAGRAEVFWPVALLMTLGAVVAARKCFSRSPLPYALVLLWISCGAAPAFLSNEGVPHALRSILMVPAIAILAAIGTTTLFSALSAFLSVSVLTWAAVLGAVLLTGEAVDTYFYLWATDPAVPIAFDASNVALAGKINAVPRPRQKIVAIQGPREAADPYYLPLVAVRFLTVSLTERQQRESNIRYYTPATFPVLITTGDFCGGVKAAMPAAQVFCVQIR